jgi:hypothetical protein
LNQNPPLHPVEVGEGGDVRMRRTIGHGSIGKRSCLIEVRAVRAELGS